MATNSASYAAAGEYVATEIAWWGCMSTSMVAAKLADAGHDVDAADVLAFAAAQGLVKPVPRMEGSYVAGRKTNARVFGRKFANWCAA